MDGALLELSLQEERLGMGPMAQCSGGYRTLSRSFERDSAESFISSRTLAKAILVMCTGSREHTKTIETRNGPILWPDSLIFHRKIIHLIHITNLIQICL